jgi:hypothetical protein
MNSLYLGGVAVTVTRADMIRVEISQAAFEAIPYAVPLSSVAYEAKTTETGKRLVWLEPVSLNRLRALRGRRESYSDVILRLATATRARSAPRG